MNFSVDSLDQVGGAGKWDVVGSTPVQTRGRRKAAERNDYDRSQLTPWEKWVVRKAREEVTQRKIQRRKACERQEQQHREKEQAVEHARRVERSYQEWLATKTEEDQRVRKMRQEKAIQKAEEDMQKQEHMEAQGKEKFSEWSMKKKEEKKERRRREQEISQKKAERDMKHKQKAQEAYTTWLKKANSTPSDQFQYYVPSFCNPEPWIGPLDGTSNGPTQS